MKLRRSTDREIQERLGRLAAELQADDPEIRIGAVEALSSMRVPGSLDLLEVALEHKDYRVFVSAAHALSRMNNDSAILRLLSATRTQQRTDLKEELVFALGETRNTAAIPALIQLLENESPAIRSAAIRALATIGDQEALETAKEKLKNDPNPKVRATLGAVIEKPEQTKQKALLRLLKHPDENVRKAASQLLKESETEAPPKL